MKRYITLAVIAAFCCSVTNAQQQGLPSRSMTIEGAYNPTVTSSDKILPVPERTTTVREPAAVSYLTEPNPMTGMERNTLAAFSETADDFKPARYAGMVRFGYGLRNIHDGLADFDWRITDRDELKVSGQMDAWASKPVDDWKSRMFNADLKIAYAHRFDKFTLGVDGAIGHSHFNYMEGVAMDSAKASKSNLMQKVLRGEIGASVAGKTADVEWYLKAGMQWLSRSGLELVGTERNNEESLLRIEGGAEMPLLGGTGGLYYRQKTAMYDWQGLYGDDYEGFSTITLSPYWKQSWGALDARMGLNVDFRTAAGYKVMASPMLNAVYNLNDRIKLLADLTGGVVDNSMRTLSTVSPYWSELARIMDGYTLANFSLGATYSAGTWFTLSAKGGYRHTINELFQIPDDNLIVTSILLQQSSDVFYGRLDADMLFGDFAELRMDVTCSGYSGDYALGSLALKPVVDASLFGNIKVMQGLDAMLTYRLMAFNEVNGSRMPAVNDLAVTFDYDFRPNLSFYLTGSRLAGGDFYYYSGYRALKPSFQLGATYRF